MRKTLFAIAACAAGLLAGCSKSESVTVTISNPLGMERVGEMVEIPVDDIYKQLNLSDTAQFVIYDEKAQEVPYQLTYDDKVIFPVSIASNASVNYTIQQGTPALVNAVVYGRYYPERLDDIAWENDRAAYRAYGPALQKSGEKAYGYDDNRNRRLHRAAADRLWNPRFDSADNRLSVRRNNRLRRRGKLYRRYEHRQHGSV